MVTRGRTCGAKISFTMDQRSMAFNRQCIDTEMEIDGPSYVPQEFCFFFGTATNVHNPNIPFANASGNVDLHHLSNHHDNSVPCGINHYTFHPPSANFDLGSSSVPRIPPFPINYGSTSQISLHGNYSVHGGAYQEYGMNHFVDSVGGPYKRKTIENLPENTYHYTNASASTSTSFMGPMDARHSAEVRLRDSSTSYGLPQCGESNGSIALDESSSSSVVRSGVAGVTSAQHTHNYGNPPNSQSFIQGSPFWFDQASSSSSIDRGVLGWSPPPPVMPFMNTLNVNGVPMEIGNQGIQGHLELNMNRNSTNFFHFPYLNAQHRNLPCLSPPVHGTRSRNGNLTFQLQPPTTFDRAPSHSVSHLGPSEPTGFRIFSPHSTAIVPETINPRHLNTPHFRVSAVDEVAVIDYDEVYGGGNYDHHMDMRLDIEDMSYEELLALGELIGNVNTGLPEETITSQLKTRTWASSLLIDLEELPCEDQEAASCIICQDMYEDHDKIGTLDCGHEYHADCLKKWLLVKNVCPICKSKALPGDTKDL